MHRRNVLQNVRLAATPVRIYTGELIRADNGEKILEEQDPLIYCERDLEAARSTAHDEGFALGVQQGDNEGFARGHAEGIIQGRKEEQLNLRSQADALDTMVSEILNERTRMLLEMRHELVRLALRMAERVCRRDLLLDDASLVRTIEAALRQVGDAQKVIVRLNPRDLATVSAHIGELGKLVSEEVHLELRSEETIAAGGCAVDTADLHVDATVDGLLERFEEALRDWYTRTTTEGTLAEAIGDDEALGAGESDAA